MEEKVEVISLRVCSWCESVMGFLKHLKNKSGAGLKTEITHGICDDCHDEVLKEIED